MLQELFVALLVSLGIMNPPLDIHGAFSLFEQGKYAQAITVIKASKSYDIKQAKDGKEKTLLIAAIAHADSLNAQCTVQEKYRAVENAINTILECVYFDKVYINARDTHWQTPLTHAVQKGYEDIALLLYTYGADPRIKDIYGKMARDYAQDATLRKLMLAIEWETYEMQRESFHIMHLLRTGSYYGARTTIMHKEEQQLVALRDQLNNSLMNAIVIFSYNFFSKPMEVREAEIITLLEHLSDKITDPHSWQLLLDLQNKQGQTALMWAARYRYYRVVHWLLEEGANALLSDTKGRKASLYTDDPLIKELLYEHELEQLQIRFN